MGRARRAVLPDDATEVESALDAAAGKLAAYASSRVVAQYGPRLEESLSGDVDRILAL